MLAPRAKPFLSFSLETTPTTTTSFDVRRASRVAVALERDLKFFAKRIFSELRSATAPESLSREDCEFAAPCAAPAASCDDAVVCEAAPSPQRARRKARRRRKEADATNAGDGVIFSLAGKRERESARVKRCLEERDVSRASRGRCFQKALEWQNALREERYTSSARAAEPACLEETLLRGNAGLDPQAGVALEPRVRDPSHGVARRQPTSSRFGIRSWVLGAGRRLSVRGSSVRSRVFLEKGTW